MARLALAQKGIKMPIIGLGHFKVLHALLNI
jgi:hypothetical protein